MSLSPTQRTLRSLRQQGRLCGIVERFLANPAAGHGIRSDLFGIIDIIVCCPIKGIVGVQSCGQDFAAHFRKITEEKIENTAEWLKCGGKLELWGWRKIKRKRGSEQMIWSPRIVEITLADLDLELERETNDVGF